jgi:hypothetical protein
MDAGRYTIEKADMKIRTQTKMIKALEASLVVQEDKIKKLAKNEISSQSVKDMSKAFKEMHKEPNDKDKRLICSLLVDSVHVYKVINDGAPKKALRNSVEVNMRFKSKATQSQKTPTGTINEAISEETPLLTENQAEW